MLGMNWAHFTFSASVTSTAAVPLLASFCRCQRILFLYRPAPGDRMTSVPALLPLILLFPSAGGARVRLQGGCNLCKCGGSGCESEIGMSQPLPLGISQGVHTTSRRLDHFPSGTAIGYAGETQAVNSQREKETNLPLSIYTSVNCKFG